MTASLVLLATAAAAAIAFAVSVAVFALSRVFSGALDRLSPAAQSRIHLTQALLPALALLGLMTAAMAPAFGWIADHCAGAGDPHHDHPHLCLDHHVVTGPALTVVALVGLFSARLFAGVWLALRGVVLSRAVRRALDRASSVDSRLAARVLPLAEPQAFVLGVVRPRLYVTRGLFSAEHAEHLSAVLAHERAHVSRRDPLLRLICHLALPFHLPGIGAWFERRLARAQEMAADAEAADRIGSREGVARALVHLTRARVGLPGFALSFGAHELESRVHRLLNPRREIDFPSPVWLLFGAAAAFGAIALSADAVHHGVEMLLGLIVG